MSIGKVGPPTVNIADDELTAERIAVIPPVFVTERVCVAVLPTVTLPKLRFAELTAIIAGCSCCAAVPVTATVAGVLLVLSATAIVPLKLPAVLGAKLTLNEMLCPAAMVAGSVGPLGIKDAVDELMLETTTAVRLPFVTDTVWEELDPSVTLPKLRSAGLRESPAAVLVLAPPGEGPTCPA